MADQPLDQAIRRTLLQVQGVDALSDAQLLQRFIDRQDESAFEFLLRRHGPMVHRVCQRILGTGAEVEDAFQAVFVVLLRKSKAIVHRDSLAGWLHGVASRVALQARSRLARRRSREKVLNERAQPDSSGAVPGLEQDREDVRAVLGEELNQLPEKYRTPLVLYYLEGKAPGDVARILNRPKNTILIWLARGRDQLRGRLMRRGLALPTSGIAGLLTEEAAPAAVPPALLTATAQGVALLDAGQPATDALSAEAMGLAETALGGMGALRRRVVLVLLLAGLATAGGVGILTHRHGAGEATPAESQAARQLELRATLESQFGAQMAFSPDGSRLATWGADGLQLWDVHSGREVGRWRPDARPDQVLVAAFSADGRRMTLATQHGSLVVFDAATGTQRTVRPWQELFRGAVPLGFGSVVFSPDCQWVANYCAGESVQLWDLNTGRLHASLGRAAAPPVFSPTGHCLAVPGLSGEAWHLLRIPSGETLATLPATNTEVMSGCAFSADGRLFITHSERAANVWDAHAGAQLLSLGGHRRPVRQVHFSPGGRAVATVAYELQGGPVEISVRDAATGKPGLSLEVSSAPALPPAWWPVVWSPGGRWLATGDGDCRLVLWEVATGRRHLHFNGNVRASLPEPRFSPDGKLVAAGRVPGSVSLWEVATGNELVVPGESEAMSAVAFAPDGKTLATCRRDGTVRLWSVHAPE